MCIDRASDTSESGAWIMIKGLDRVKISYTLRVNFKTSNNKAEYKAIIASLKMEKIVGAKDFNKVRVFINNG